MKRPVGKGGGAFFFACRRDFVAVSFVMAELVLSLGVFFWRGVAVRDRGMEVSFKTERVQSCAPRELPSISYARSAGQHAANAPGARRHPKTGVGAHFGVASGRRPCGRLLSS
jgi:hypothetical protein